MDARTRPSDSTLARNVGTLLDGLAVGPMHRRVILAVGLGLFFDIYEVFLSGSISTALSASFKVSPAQLSLLLASAFLGMFVGAAFLGWLADRIGRRQAFLLNLLWYSLWSIIGAFSPNAWFLVAARFLAGVGVGAEYPVADAYLSDTMPKDKRGRLASWAYTTSFVAVPVVGFLALWLNATHPLGIAGWRWLMGFGAIGAVVVVVMRRGLPESPRWLAHRGRFAEARAGLAAFGASPAAIATLDAAPAVAGVDESSIERTSLLNRKPYRARLAMLTVFHLLQTFGYYGFGTLAALVLVARGYNVTASLLYVALSYLGYPIGSLLSTPLLRVVERKVLIISSLVALAITGIVFATATVPAVIVIFGFLTTVISNVFSNAYHVYQAEIFPTRVRATAVGWTYSLSRLSSGALPFILLPVLHAHGALPMFLIVAAALVIVCVVVGAIGPRTSRRSVEEINPE